MWHIFLLRFILASTYTMGRASFTIVKPLFFTGTRMSLAGLILLDWCWFKLKEVFNLQPYFILLFLSILATITTFLVYAYLLKRYSATFLAFSSFLEPLFAAIFAWFIFAEGISWHFMNALWLLSLGLYIFYKEEIQIESLSIKES